MKTSLFVILLNFFSITSFAQLKNDLVLQESEVVLKTIKGDLFGALTTPDNVTTYPVVLIIAGSGPTDRDCNSAMGFQTNAYKMLAESFAKSGIATLRYDKRGIGKSKSAMISESELRFETYINDAVEWIKLLKTDKRFTSVIVLGHSEGSLIGMVAAQQIKIDKFISIAGSGKSADNLLKDQLKTNLTFQLLLESNRILDSLKSGKTVSNVNSQLFSLFRPSVQPYMISWMKYDPVNEIAKLNIPILIIQGTTDLQVPVEDAKLLSAANRNAKLFIVEKMNHVLKEADSNVQQNRATYANPALPLKEGLTDELVSFIKH